MLLPLLWYWNGMEGPSFTDKWYPSLQPLMQFSVRDFSFPAFYMQMLPRHPCAAEGSCPWLTVRKMRSRRNVSDLVTAWVKGMLRATSLKRSSAWVNLHPACPCSREEETFALHLLLLIQLCSQTWESCWQGCAATAVGLGRNQSGSCGTVSWWGSWAVGGICSLAANGWGQLWDGGREKLYGLKYRPLWESKKGGQFSLAPMEHPNAGGISSGFGLLTRDKHEPWDVGLDVGLSWLLALRAGLWAQLMFGSSPGPGHHFLPAFLELWVGFNSMELWKEGSWMCHHSSAPCRWCMWNIYSV